MTRIGVSFRVMTGAVASVVLVIVLITALIWPEFLRQEEAYAFKGGFYEPPNPAAELSLLDQNQQPFDLNEHRGKVILLYFGYTYCPTYCPTTLVEMQAVEDLMGEQAGDVEVVMVTVDPLRDTPARLKEYMEFFDPSFIGLSGTEEAISAIKVPYGAFAEKQAPDASGAYLVDHSTSLFAIDPDGNLRLTWPYGTSPEDISSDVRHLLR